MNGGWGISYEIALRWMPLDLTDDKSTLLHYLSQCWPRSRRHMASLGHTNQGCCIEEHWQMNPMKHGYIITTNQSTRNPYGHCKQCTVRPYILSYNIKLDYKTCILNKVYEQRDHVVIIYSRLIGVINSINKQNYFLHGILHVISHCMVMHTADDCTIL